MANDFKSLSDKVKPREQLRDAVSPAELKDEALLAILLKTGVPGCNVIELSRRMLSAFDSIAEMVKSDWRTLEGRIKEYNAAHPEKSIRGLGPVKIMELAAAFALPSDLPVTAAPATDGRKRPATSATVLMRNNFVIKYSLCIIAD